MVGAVRRSEPLVRELRQLSDPMQLLPLQRCIIARPSSAGDEAERSSAKSLG